MNSWRFSFLFAFLKSKKCFMISISQSHEILNYYILLFLWLFSVFLLIIVKSWILHVLYCLIYLARNWPILHPMDIVEMDFERILKTHYFLFTSSSSLCGNDHSKLLTLDTYTFLNKRLKTTFVWNLRKELQSEND